MNQHYTYASCSYCGGSCEEQLVRTEFWLGEQLVVFEQVPVGVCTHCGEEYFRADIHDKMIELSRESPKKHLSVPVYKFIIDELYVKARSRRKKKDIDDSHPIREEEIHLASEDELKELSELDANDEWEEL